VGLWSLWEEQGWDVEVSCWCVEGGSGLQEEGKVIDGEEGRER
jgi:hypothetical protein